MFAMACLVAPALLAACGGEEKPRDESLWKLPHGEERAKFRRLARDYFFPPQGCLPDWTRDTNKRRHKTVLEEQVKDTVLAEDLNVVLDDAREFISYQSSTDAYFCIPKEKTPEQLEARDQRVRDELDRKWERLNKATTVALELLS